MEPQLHLLARPSFSNEHEKFLASEGLTWRVLGATAAERLIEFAGRVCYMSFGARQSDKSNFQYIRNLIEHGHESVLEHANWTFLLVGVSRAFTHQLVRHRPGFAFSQLSQQYHDEADATFIEPQGLEDAPAAREAWAALVEHSRQAYLKIRNELNRHATGRPDWSQKEISRYINSSARSVLPNAIETKIVVTANARAIRHFLMVRGAIDGDYEMRFASKLIYEMVSNDAPSLVADFKLSTLSDGSPEVRLRGETRAM